MIFITEGLFEVGVEPTTTEFHSDSLTDWAIRPWIQFALRLDFVQSLQFHRLFSVRFHFGYCLRQFPHLFLLRFCRGNHMNVAEWTDVCGIYHWRTLWRSYKKLALVGLEPTTTEFHSDSLTDWTIRPWVQFAIEANFVQSLQFHHLFSVRFQFGYCLCQSPHLFELKFCGGNPTSVA